MRFPSLFTFCPHCSTALRPFTEDGVARRRCTQCGWVQYRNPTLGVAVVILEGYQLLIGRRRDGGWCIPCGHVEWDESVEQAALREIAEETGLDVALRGVLAVKSNFHDPENQTVGVWFRGVRTGGSFEPGGDLVEVQFVNLEQVPDLKFPTDREVLQELRLTLASERDQT